jgi:hypothetical protein
MDIDELGKDTSLSRIRSPRFYRPRGLRPRVRIAFHNTATAGDRGDRVRQVRCKYC